MLIGLKTVDDLRLLHLSTPTVRAIETWEFIGCGAELGIYKAGQYGLKDMPTDTAAPIIAYIVDIVKNNVPFCGRSTSLAVLHTNGNVEHKNQDYISKTTQGYKSIGWLLPESGVKIAILGLDRFQSVNLAQDVISQIL
jgi:hypothetical protein